MMHIGTGAAVGVDLSGLFLQWLRATRTSDPPRFLLRCLGFCAPHRWLPTRAMIGVANFGQSLILQ